MLKDQCNHEGLKNKARKLLQLLESGSKKAIIHQRSHGKKLRHTHGMSVYFPLSPINPQYRELDFYRDCRWGEFIERFSGGSSGNHGRMRH